jgi:hypothetical protein
MCLFLHVLVSVSPSAAMSTKVQRSRGGNGSMAIASAPLIAPPMCVVSIGAAFPANAGLAQRTEWRAVAMKFLTTLGRRGVFAMLAPSPP